MKFHKYHGLGNDYIILDPADIGPVPPTPEQIRLICHRNYGPGSDGILYGPAPSDEGRPSVRIYNPDGGEAEKSGNGLRIFSRYLYDQGRVGPEEFEIDTLGGRVRSQVGDAGRKVTVEMGRVRFDAESIPVAGPPREVIQEEIKVKGETFLFTAATIGNPHCVILCDAISESMAREFGPSIEVDPRFPRKTNVQFMQVLDRSNIRIEIWERGAGYTLASGSSSSASAAVARRLGFCDARQTVHMPGGKLEISIAEDYAVTMSGGVTRVAEGEIVDEAFSVSVS